MYGVSDPHQERVPSTRLPFENKTSEGVRTCDHTPGTALPAAVPGVTARRRNKPFAAREERESDMAKREVPIPPRAQSSAQGPAFSFKGLDACVAGPRSADPMA
tara:strand:- start:16118 stop:16429 length:312 start_codon:yes stop_codon:yes gene_type:complete